MNLFVRPAQPADLRQLASFLPRWHRIEDDACWVAEATQPVRLVGFSILGRRPGPGGETIAYLDVALLPRFRDGGILDQLLAPSLKHAVEFPVREVLLATPRRRESPDFTLLEQLGFEEHRSLITYEFSLPAFADRSIATHQRMIQRSAIPSGAEVTALAPAHWQAAVDILRSEQLIDPAMIAEAERVGLEDFLSPATSVVSLDGEVKGVVITHARGRQLETSALAVHPRLRGGAGWVNALLSWRVARIAPALGHETITMSADPNKHPMTTRLAQRMKAKTLFVEIMLQKSLTIIR